MKLASASEHQIDVAAVAYSIAPHGGRIITLKCKYHRLFHSEVLMHRALSRSCSSSAAKPVSVGLNEEIMLPVRPGKNQKGMTIAEELDETTLNLFLQEWVELAGICKSYSDRWANDYNVHKRWANRPMEWFLPIDVTITATDWENFFELRGRQPYGALQEEFRVFAGLVEQVRDASEPEALDYGEWHLPYISEKELQDPMKSLIQVSAARCARTSYSNHDGTAPDLIKDLGLFMNLVTLNHLNPFEHQATPAEPSKYSYNLKGWKSQRWFLDNDAYQLIGSEVRL